MKIIYDYMQLVGMTQADLASRAGMDVSALNNLLRGRRKPGMITLKQLNKATGITIENLVRAIADEETAKEAKKSTTDSIAAQ